MSDHLTHLGMLAARADKLAAQLEHDGEKTLAVVQRDLAERYRLALTDAVHSVKAHHKEETNAA